MPKVTNIYFIVDAFFCKKVAWAEGKFSNRKRKRQNMLIEFGHKAKTIGDGAFKDAIFSYSAERNGMLFFERFGARLSVALRINQV